MFCSGGEGNSSDVSRCCGTSCSYNFLSLVIDSAISKKVKMAQSCFAPVTLAIKISDQISCNSKSLHRGN
jgi:hypothetical protein